MLAEAEVDLPVEVLAVSAAVVKADLLPTMVESIQAVELDVVDTLLAQLEDLV